MDYLSCGNVTRNRQAQIVVGKDWNDCTPEELEKVRAYKKALQEKNARPRHRR